MPTFLHVLDDYLHQIIRTRPWTKQREEELLTAFGEWLVAQPEREWSLQGVTPEAATVFAVATAMNRAEQDQLTTALANVLAWADYQGMAAVGPFATELI